MRTLNKKNRSQFALCQSNTTFRNCYKLCLIHKQKICQLLLMTNDIQKMTFDVLHKTSTNDCSKFSLCIPMLMIHEHERNSSTMKRTLGPLLLMWQLILYNVRLFPAFYCWVLSNTNRCTMKGITSASTILSKHFGEFLRFLAVNCI